MAYTNGISSAVACYVYTQSNGAVTEPVNGSYIQALCEYLGATTLIGNSWLITLCDYYGITEPLHASWTIALANHYGITTPIGGTWWQALCDAAYVPPYPPFIWNLDTLTYNTETRKWSGIPPVTDYWEDNVELWEVDTQLWELA